MNVDDDTQIFDQVFRVWVRRACREWNYELPPEFYFSEIYVQRYWPALATYQVG